MRKIVLLPLATLAATLGFGLAGLLLLVLQVWATLILSNSNASGGVALLNVGWYAVLACFASSIISVVATHYLAINAVTKIKQAAALIPGVVTNSLTQQFLTTMKARGASHLIIKGLTLLMALIYQWRSSRETISANTMPISIGQRSVQRSFYSFIKDSVTVMGMKFVTDILQRSIKQSHLIRPVEL